MVSLILIVPVVIIVLFALNRTEKNQIFKNYKNLVKMYNQLPTDFLPPMSFNQIVALLEVPELKIEQVVASIDEVGRIDVDEDYRRSEKFLLVYYSKNKRISKKDRIHYETGTFFLNDCIFIMPENKDEYKKLCKYYLDSEKFKKDIKIQSSQLENLKEVRRVLNQIHNESDKSINDCLDEIKKWSTNNGK